MTRRIAGFVAFSMLLMGGLSDMSVADKLDRSKRPPVGPAPTLVAPKVIKRQLSNGLVVWIARRPQLPQTTILLQIRGGSSLDTKPGVAAMTAALSLSFGIASRMAVSSSAPRTVYISCCARAW